MTSVRIGETKVEDTLAETSTIPVYDPFTDSPQQEKASKPVVQVPQQDLAPLVIKWGTRARDRMRAAGATDSPPSAKMLPVRQAIDLSSSSMEESPAAHYMPATSGASNPSTSFSGKAGSHIGGGANMSSLKLGSFASPSDKSVNTSIQSKEYKRMSSGGGSWDGVRSILPFSKPSPRKSATWQHSALDPSTPTPPPRWEPEAEEYSTPPRSTAPVLIQNSGDSCEPPRPQKAENDVARAKYEMATRARQKSMDIALQSPADGNYNDDNATEDLSTSSSQGCSLSPERNGRLSADAHVLASVSVKDRAAAFLASPPQDYLRRKSEASAIQKRRGPTYDQSEDIPMNSSLSPGRRSKVDGDNELSSSRRQTLPGNLASSCTNSFDRINGSNRPYDPYELETQLKRRPPPQTQLGMMDGVHGPAAYV